jgi:hypothetical protein
MSIEQIEEFKRLSQSYPTKIRMCLQCRKPFKSKCPGNRRCNVCSKNANKSFDDARDYFLTSLPIKEISDD